MATSMQDTFSAPSARPHASGMGLTSGQFQFPSMGIPGFAMAQDTGMSSRWAQQGRQSVNIAHVVALDGSQGKAAAFQKLGLNQLVFECSAKTRASGAMGIQVKTMITLSAMNVFLRTPEGRKLYGSHTDAAQIRRDYRFAGIQATPVGDAWHRGRVEVALTTHVRYIARTFNMWRGERMLTPGDKLYLVLVRRPYIPSFKPLDDDEDEKNPDYGYYWRWEPYATQSRMRPGPSVHSGADFTGSVLYVGMAHRFYRDDPNNKYGPCVEAALYPDNTASIASACTRLPELEVELGVQ